VQALDEAGTVQVTASAPGFVNGTGTVTLNPSGFYISTPASISTNTLNANTNLVACVARLNPTTLNYQAQGTLRFGITPVSVSMTSSNTAVGVIVGSPRTIAGNANCTPSTGALQFDPVGAGTSTVAMGPTPAGFSTPSNLQSIVATVTTPGIDVGSPTVGKNLQAQALNTQNSLQSPAPVGGTTVTLTSADPSKLLLAPNATTVGMASITVNVAQGGTGFSYFVQALDDTGTVQVTASAPGFANGSGTVTLHPSGFYIGTPSTDISANTLDANTNLVVCVARLNPATLNYAAQGTLRFGITPVSVGMTSSDTAVGLIVGSPRTIAGNSNCTPSTGALQFDPVGAGTTILAMGPTPAGFSAPSNLQSIVATVTASGINLSSPTIGKNLQAQALNTQNSLQSPAPPGGTTVTLTSADPSKVLLAPNATTVGMASITVAVAQGATGFSYYVQALDEAGTVQVTASAPGFVNGTGTVTLVPSGFVILTPTSINTTAAGANVNLRLCAARLSPTTLNYAAQGTLRFGVAPASVGATSSNTAAGAIVNSPANVAGNENCTATGAAGVNFDPIAPGTTTVSITPPAGFSIPSNMQQINATVN
jgi:hypothetical protein